MLQSLCLFCIAALIFLSTSCGGSAGNDRAQCVSADANDAVEILFLGDSATVGALVDPSQIYPKQLINVLRLSNPNVADPILVAQGGWRTDNLLAGLAAANLDPPYDVVILFIGGNDLLQGVSDNTFGANFSRVLDRAIDLSGNCPGRVIVLSIPDFTLTPLFAGNPNKEAIKARIGRYNVIVSNAVEDEGTRYADIREVYKRTENNPSMVASDGFHPSAQMYSLWVGVIAPIVEDILPGG